MKCPRCEGVLVGETLGRPPPSDAGPYRSLPSDPCRGSPESVKRESARRIVVDRCTSCNGFWFDRGEMQAAIRDAKLGDSARPRSPRVEAQSASRRPAPRAGREQLGPCGPCPRCGASMAAVESQAAPDVEYDRCTSCEGIWFDAGEAEQFAGDVGLFALMLHEFDRG